MRRVTAVPTRSSHGMARTVILVATMLASWSCSDSAAPGPTPSWTLALSPASRTIARGSSGVVQVNLNRINHALAVALSIEGAPGAVTTTFAPTSTTGSASTLTIVVGAAAVAGEYQITVKAVSSANGAAGTAGTAEEEAMFSLTIADANVMLAGGWHHSLALTPDGSLWAFGRNSVGQLGDGTLTNRTIPTLIMNGISWRAVVASEAHTLAIRSDGTLWGWGDNSHGQLGDGTTTSRQSPAPIAAGSTWRTVATSEEHTLAIRSDGTLWAWGSNQYRQLGDGSNTPRLLPVQVGSATDWTVIVAGYSHSLALKSDGTLWAWGNNGNGQHGDGATDGKATPVQTGSETTWTSLAADGGHVLALKADGSLWAWGSNSFGQLGDGTATGPVNSSRYLPTAIAIGSSWRTIATGLSHSIAIRSDGTLWTWGANDIGQVGDGTTGNIRAAPTQIGVDNDWSTIEGGDFHTLAAKRDGTVWGWGFNFFGHLGDGTTITRLSPSQVALPGAQ